MGFFFGKDKSNDVMDDSISGKIRSLLDAADKAYMRALSEKNINYLKGFSRDLIVKINRLIYSPEQSYFGSDKFRRTSWTVEEQSSTQLVVKKSVRYDKVKVGGSLSLQVAVDYDEVWRVDKSEQLIIDIQGVKAYA